MMATNVIEAIVLTSVFIYMMMLLSKYHSFLYRKMKKTLVLYYLGTLCQNLVTIWLPITSLILTEVYS